MEDTEFACCYQRMVTQFRMTPEENERQLAKILRRIGAPGPERSSPERVP